MAVMCCALEHICNGHAAWSARTPLWYIDIDSQTAILSSNTYQWVCTFSV